MELFGQMMKRVITLTLVLALGSFAAFAQQTTGTLRGQVADEFGGLIVGATVTVTDASGVAKTATSDAGGNYVVAGLAPGTYLVNVGAAGFADFTDEAVEVGAGSRKQLDVKLSVTIEKQEVSVAAEGAINTEPENNAGAVVLRGTDLDSLPDDPDELAAALQALAGPSSGPNGGQFFIDGFTGGRLPPKESIREIRINSNPFSAEFDRLGFGRVEILTKPGTDKLRGQVSMNFGDESLNSRNPFVPARPPYQLRQFGGNLSGPIVAKKSSFFLDFEKRDIDENANVNATILDAALNPTGFSQAIVTPIRRTTFSPRVDYQINASNTLVARYTYARSSFQNVGTGYFDLLSRAYNTSSREHTIQLTETAVLSPSVINETRFQFIHRRNDQTGDNSLPTIRVLDAFNGGGSQIGISFNNEDRYELQNYTTYAFGKHSLKAGGRLRAVRINDVSRNNFGGTFTFTSLDQYRNTLLGVAGAGPTQFSIAGGDPQADVKQVDVGLFAQDDWRVRPDFTLSLGLRYENQSNINSNMNFSPRIGFAYSPGAGGARQPKMVIRGGFGVFYDRFSENLTLQADRFDGSADSQQQFIVSSFTPGGAAILSQFPNVPTIATLQGFALPQTTRQVAANLQVPYTSQLAISVERQLPFKLTLSTTFISARTEHLLRSRNINAPYFITPTTTVRPFGNNSNIIEFESSGKLNQNQLIINLTNRFSQNLSFGAFYSLNKASSDSDGVGTMPAYSYDLSNEYGRSSLDVRHTFRFFGSIAAPWGIRLSPFLIARSGLPFNITTGRDINGDLQFTERPALATDLTKPGVIVTRFGAFDPNPALGQTIIPRNFGSGPNFFSVNLRLNKVFGFGEVKRSTAAADASQPAASGQAQSGRSGGRRGGGGSSSGGPLSAGGLLGGGGRGGRGGAGGGAGAASEKRYNLSVGFQITNIFNRTNFGAITGNLSSPFFGLANSTAGNFGFGGGNTAAAGNRRIEAQLRFNF
jgi:hypothetical protein